MAIAACHGTTPTSALHQTVKASADPVATSSSVAPAGAASTAPPATPTALPSAASSSAPTSLPSAAAVLGTLQPPTTPFTQLAGTIVVDPTYLVAAGGGTLISNNGGSVIALGDAGIVSDQGSNLIAGTAGGSALVDNSGAFLSAGNAGLLSNNGAGLISNHGGGYRVQDTAAAAITSSVLPAAGLAVSAVSLLTHTYVPVGQDATGHPVYTIYSDAQGGYKIYVPSAAQDNVVVVANVPRTQDRRLVFNAIAPAQGGAVGLSDDASSGTRLARTILAGQMAEIMTSADVDATVLTVTAGSDGLPTASRAVIAQLVTALSSAARAHHVPTTPGAIDLPDVQALSTLLADQLLGILPFDAMRLGLPFNTNWPGSNEQVYAALDGAFSVLRESTARYMAVKVGAGATLPLQFSYQRYVQVGAQEDFCVFTDSFAIKEPADTGTYLVGDVLSRTQGHGIANTEQLFAALATASTPGVEDLNALQPGDPEYYLDPSTHQVLPAARRLQAALDVLLGYFALTLAPPGGAPTPAFNTLIASLGTFADAHTFAGAPSPLPRLGTGTLCVPPPLADTAATPTATP